MLLLLLMVMSRLKDDNDDDNFDGHGKTDNTEFVELRNTTKKYSRMERMKTMHVHVLKNGRLQ